VPRWWCCRHERPRGEWINSSARRRIKFVGCYCELLGNLSIAIVSHAAVANNRFSIFDNVFGIELASASSTRWGGTVGVGWEYGFAPNWSVGVEYDHLFLGDANNSFSIVNPNVVGVLNSRVSQDVDMLTLRVNYRFGGYGAGYGGPGGARY